MRIYKEETLDGYLVWSWLEVEIFKKSLKSQSLWMVIPIRSRSQKITIPNQMIADHQYPAILTMHH